jgi:hypothetical protein
MLTLLSKYEGKHGVIRDYQHPRLGAIEVVATWKTPGAHVVHVMHWRKARVPLDKAPVKKQKRA